ncbi:hypothetical protein [Nostoc sp. WHI]|uniref:hypothetical protein n=1 Tax=Nostoc sp. WHI TaxID=2650611 RepID=UPI003FA52F68
MATTLQVLGGLKAVMNLQSSFGITVATTLQVLGGLKVHLYAFSPMMYRWQQPSRSGWVESWILEVLIYQGIVATTLQVLGGLKVYADYCW